MDKDYKKLYEEALERARDLHDNHPLGQPQIWSTCEKIFPELRESEDEKIRKSLIKGLSAMRDIHKHQTFSDDAINIDDAIAWLEKQGEKEPIEQDTEIRDLWEYIGEWRDKFGRLPKDEDELADCIFYVMKRQKPADKVESKFKVGDWITNGEYTWFIEGIHNGFYDILSPEGCGTDDTITYVDDNFHLWTIQDAKDGDVLVNDNDIFVFDGTLEEKRFPFAYCGISNGDFGIYNRNIPFTHNRDIYPATKEKRDLLFSKMKEAGYEWDAEKKELKKIKQKSSDFYCKENCKGFQETGKCFADGECEAKKKAEQNPAWSEEDEEMFDAVIADIQFTQKAHNHEVNQVVYEREIDWLKSIKDRIQHQSKQEWSEYDKIQLSEAIQMIEANGTWIRSKDAVKKVSNWLKSLKPQSSLYDKGYNDGYSAAKYNSWKPSEEQLRAIINSAQGLYQCKEKEVLLDLYEQLKNL